MKKIRWNRDWKFQNDIHKTQEVTVSLPHDAMQTEKRLEGMKNGAAAGVLPRGQICLPKNPVRGGGFPGSGGIPGI